MEDGANCATEVLTMGGEGASKVGSYQQPRNEADYDCFSPLSKVLKH